MHRFPVEPRSAAAHSLRAEHHAPGLPSLPYSESLLTDADILSVLCDLFAGRAATAFGESLEWWAETFQCDLAAEAAGGVVLAAISKWPFDQRAGAEGVQQLQAELVKRARQILAREVQP